MCELDGMISRLTHASASNDNQPQTGVTDYDTDLIEEF